MSRNWVHVDKYIFLGLCAGALVLNAGDISAAGPCSSCGDLSYVASLSLGPATSNVSIKKESTQTFILPDGVPASYATTKKRHALAIGELFLAFQWLVGETSSAQLGLALMATSNATMTGNIAVGTIPAVSSYTYKYGIHHEHLALKAKWLFEPGEMIILPYISGSVGIGQNQTTRFNITPAVIPGVTKSIFTNEKTTGLAYTLGAGLQYPIDPNWQIGLGYEFTNWGKSQLKASSGNTLNDALVLNNLTSNALMFSINFTY